MTAWGIILAGGSGSRLAGATGDVPKQFVLWKDRPLYWHSALAMSRAGCIDGLIFVFPQESLAGENERIKILDSADNLGLAWLAVPGGATRQDSAAAGIAVLPADCDRVLIHDAARCFATPGLFRRVLESLGDSCPAVIPGLPVTDTIKLVNDTDSDSIAATLPRSRLRAVQTPQGFLLEALRTAMSRVASPVTDDASFMEMAGFRVEIIKGEAGNIKITRPEDLRELALEPCLPESCSGFGYDAHRYGRGRPLKLGGVPIPGDYQVIAHSDGDVLLHSLMDALLGCACLGDIGSHFPDSSSQYEGISSAILLDHVLDLLAAKKIRPVHIDLTVVAQKPKLMPYSSQIRRNVARLVRLPEDRVNFKATTEEKMGFTGRLEGIKAFSLVNALRLK